MNDRECARRVVDRLLANGAKRIPPDLLRVAEFVPPPSDELQSQVAAYLDGRPDTTAQEVATALAESVQRAGRALKALGWARRSKRIGPSRKWIYVRPRSSA
jgi:hypothetical protein